MITPCILSRATDTNTVKRRHPRQKSSFAHRTHHRRGRPRYTVRLVHAQRSAQGMCAQVPNAVPCPPRTRSRRKQTTTAARPPRHAVRTRGDDSANGVHNWSAWSVDLPPPFTKMSRYDPPVSGISRATLRPSRSSTHRHDHQYQRSWTQHERCPFSPPITAGRRDGIGWNVHKSIGSAWLSC